MIDSNEEITPEAPEEVPAPEVSPESVEVDPAADPAPESASDSVEPSAPVEVVTVDDLLDRISGESQEDVQTEELPHEEESVADYVPENNLPAAQVDGGSLEVIGMNILLDRLEAIQEQTDEHPEHPMMTTPFENYSVAEGLLLLIFVILLLDFFLNILRRWF